MFSSNGSQVSNDANYIEDVFSTYLYTGNSGTQTITNNIDLSTKGGMVWIKGRDIATNNLLFDTNRGVNNYLVSDGTNAQANPGDTLSAFNANGFTVKDLSNFINETGFNYASWTFRKQPKFFDIVTYTGNGTNGRTVAHSLGSEPGCIIVKASSGASHWSVYHRSIGNTGAVRLNLTGATDTSIYYWNNTSPTSTEFSVANETNSNGVTYVAYIFAHDAGGFGLTGTDNVISCGSFTTDGSGNATVNLGYEPQWVLVKRTDSSIAGSWHLIDTMRGWDMGSSDEYLYANTSDSTVTAQRGNPTATGFNAAFAFSASYIYIAIRRGPMKVPTDATKVFAVDTDRNATKPGFTSNFPVDFVTRLYRSGGANMRNGSRLTGANHLESNTTAAEAADTEMTWDYMTGWGNDTGATSVIVSHMFRRAPSFFDEVCYTGNGSARTVTHNLGATPEMILFKRRDASAQWQFYFAGIGNTKSVQMPDNDKVTSVAMFNNTSPTSSEFTVGISSTVNASGGTYVAYLAATCAGVSKVGTYTGTGAAQQINCGFTAGARFVLIKNVGVNDYAYGYYLWDSARGIVAGNDPYLLLSSTAAEVTSTDYIDPLSTGFEISSTAPVGINENGAQFVYWAIA